MDVLILTPVSMLGELRERCFAEQNDIKVTKWVADFERLRTVVKGLAVTRTSPDGEPASILVLIDVTQGVDLDEVRQLAIDYPRVILLALRLKSQRQDVVRAGRAGFCAFVSRDAVVTTLIKAMRDAVAGRLSCSEEIAGGLLRALFRGAANADSLSDSTSPPPDDTCLTRRESDVARLISRGLSNKEIARELTHSVATVKHHVHSVLGKYYQNGWVTHRAMLTIRVGGARLGFSRGYAINFNSPHTGARCDVTAPAAAWLVLPLLTLVHPYSARYAPKVTLRGDSSRTSKTDTRFSPCVVTGERVDEPVRNVVAFEAKLKRFCNFRGSSITPGKISPPRTQRTRCDFLSRNATLCDRLQQEG